MSQPAARLPDAEIDALEASIGELLRRDFPEIRLALLFGSLARRQGVRWDSDLDLAVAADRPLSADRLWELRSALVELSGRPVDLIDLRRLLIPVTRQAMTHGKAILEADPRIRGEILARMLSEEADYLPLLRRLRAERRQAWIGN